MNVLLSVIDPVAISIGPIKIYWYGIIIALAMLIGISLATKEAQKLGLEEDTMVDMALWAIPIGFIGARLYYVLFKWDYYIQNPSEIIAIWNGGIAIYGGLIAGGLAVYWFARRKKMTLTLEIAKQRPDFREGRPKKYSQQQIDLAMRLLEKHSYTEVEKMTGISKSTLTRYKKKWLTTEG